ncbi:hypothetical protein [Luteimonas cucumeris]|uniref:hypothetical protein n=1 Tax=Luteimonas cucumeris TaxID=985012 RepID=UPI0011A06C4D|nr:hypothetical protein [Luteimonas cucumeris]
MNRFQTVLTSGCRSIRAFPATGADYELVSPRFPESDNFSSQVAPDRGTHVGDSDQEVKAVFRHR